MHSGDYNTLARNAIAVAQGRQDPRLLVASKRKLLKPKRAARWLAGLANAAGDRHAVLLMGVDNGSIVGIKNPPRSSWLAEVSTWFPGVRPALSWEFVTVDDTEVLAVMPSAVTQHVTAFHRSEVLVPWVTDGVLGQAPLGHACPQGGAPAIMPAVSAKDCWVERTATVASGVEVDVYRGMVTLAIGPMPGVVADKSCSATLLLLQDHAPVELDVQVHPGPGPVGVERQTGGVTVHAGYSLRIYLAGALLSSGVRSTNRSARLVLSLLLPGRSVPELRSFPLQADPNRADRWQFNAQSGGPAR